jgi:hypothetical protein
MGRTSSTARAAAGGSPATTDARSQEFEGVVEGGVIKRNGRLPEGTRVQVRAKK